MPDAPEIPEAKDPFDKRVALTIAILAICLSFIANLGDNAKTSSILRTSEASDQWNFFQAKSTKAQLAAMHGDLMMRLSSEERFEDSKNRAVELGKDAQRYDIEKAEIKKEAESLVAQAKHFSAINDRCDQAALLLQIACDRLLGRDPGSIAQVLVAGDDPGCRGRGRRRHRLFHVSRRSADMRKHVPPLSEPHVRETDCDLIDHLRQFRMRSFKRFDGRRQTIQGGFD